MWRLTTFGVSSLIIVLLCVQLTCGKDVCETDTCQKAAENLKNSIDESVDPCDDFHKFVCGEWLERHEIPEGSQETGVFDQVQDVLHDRIVGIASEEIKESDPFYVNSGKRYYQKCIDTDGIEENEEKSLMSVLDRVGGWPLLQGDKWKEDDFEWSDLMIKLKDEGMDYTMIILFEPTPDFQDTSKQTLGISEGSLQMDKMIVDVTSDHTMNYVEFIREVAKKLGAETGQEMEDQLIELAEFEIQLGQMALTPAERRQLTEHYKRVQVGELNEFQPDIPWKKILDSLFKDDVDDSLTAIVLNERFIKNLTSVISDTPKRAVANFMIWKSLKGIMFTLSEKFRKLTRTYRDFMTGGGEDPQRWKQCVKLMDEEFGEAFSSKYVEKYFGKEHKERALKEVKYIHGSFKNTLKHNDWMQTPTLKAAREKADNMDLQIGFPDEILDEDKMSKYYEGLSIPEDETFFDANRRANRWSQQKELETVGEVHESSDWRTYGKVNVVNAYYRVLDNTIFFPAGFLQDVVFDKDKPGYLNFGSLGFISGHELTHGFDDLGKQFDSEGNNVNWWDKVTDEKFQEAAECIVKEYSKFTVEDDDGKIHHLNGTNTIGENIADVGGLKIAYLAYNEYKKDLSEPELPLSGLDYSTDQLFWIGFGSVWCHKSTTEQKVKTVNRGSHSPHDIRIIGAVQNSEYFADAFGCAEGSK